MKCGTKQMTCKNTWYKVLIDKANDKAIAVWYISSMLQKLYTFAKIFNILIDKAVWTYNFRLL